MQLGRHLEGTRIPSPMQHVLNKVPPDNPSGFTKQEIPSSGYGKPQKS